MDDAIPPESREKYEAMYHSTKDTGDGVSGVMPMRVSGIPPPPGMRVAGERTSRPASGCTKTQIPQLFRHTYISLVGRVREEDEEEEMVEDQDRELVM